MTDLDVALLISVLTHNLLCILCRAKENKQPEINYQNILKDSKNRQNIEKLKTKLAIIFS